MTTGVTWVLLRGLTRGSGHWGDFPDRLRARFPASRVIALDLPGNGEWHRQPSPTLIEAMRAWCQARLHERVDGASPCMLLAMSMGAMVAVDWARHAPDEIAGSVLINTSLRPFSPWHHRLRPAAIAALLRLSLRAGDDRERAILRLTSALPAARATATLERWVQLRRQQPVSLANALRQLRAAARYAAPDEAPSVPLLVLASAGDALVDSRCSRRLAECWGAELAIQPWAGHDVALDDPAWVVERIAQWTERRALITACSPPAAPSTG